MSMTPGEMFRMLHELRQAHRDLDQAIAELEKAKGEELAIKRLKNASSCKKIKSPGWKISSFQMSLLSR
jgi:hypothetical protein